MVTRLPNGHYLSYMRIVRSTGPSSQARPCATCDSIRHSLDYGGGGVMPSSTNYVIAWVPQGYSGNPFQDAAGPGYQGDPGLDSGNCDGDICGYMYGVAQYFKDLAAASGQNTNSNSVATQYNDGFGHTAASNVQVAPAGNGPNGVYLDTDPVPGGSGCTVTATTTEGGDASGQGGFCITDAQVQSELNSFLTAHGLPRGLTNEYYLLTPPDVVTCLDQQGTECSGNAPIDSASFCAYHSAATLGSSAFLYSLIADSSGTPTSGFNDGVSGCDPFATDGECANGIICNYNSNFAEGSLSAVAHEQIESLTDPIPPTGWNDDEENPPTPTDGAEIGDLCNNDQADDPATNYQTDSSGTDTPFNYTIAGHHYWIQMEYSNQGVSCAHAITPEAPPNSHFVVSTLVTTSRSTRADHARAHRACTCGSSATIKVWGSLVDSHSRWPVRAPGGAAVRRSHTRSRAAEPTALP